MSDRTYRTLLGALILALLYFELRTGMLALVCVLLFEGITGLRVPLLVSRVRGSKVPAPPPVAARWAIEAERVWRLVVGSLLLIGTVLFPDRLWFFSWFMGFAILGAGLSGVCPVLLAIRALGFR